MNEKDTGRTPKDARTPLLGMGALIGTFAGFGLIIGVILNNLVLWMMIGAALGTVAGAVAESRRL